MFKSIKLVSALTASAIILSFGAGTATAQSNDADKKINLKVGHVLAPNHPYQVALEKFSEIVNENSDGRINIDVFHSSSLGGEREMIEGLQMGTLDMTLVSTAPLAGFNNSFLVFDLPFIFQDKESAYKVLDGEIGAEIMDSLEDVGIKGLSYWENGFRHITNSGGPVVLPEDMKGKKVRTMENKIHMDSFRTVGADPTPMAFGELFTALQQKTVDAQENPIPIIFTSNFFEVQKYLSLTGHFYAAAPLLISKHVWDSLDESDQELLYEASIQARDFERELIAEMDNNYIETLNEKGMLIDEIDKDVWKDAMAPVYSKYEKEIGAEMIQKVSDAQK